MSSERHVDYRVLKILAEELMQIPIRKQYRNKLKNVIETLKKIQFFSTPRYTTMGDINRTLKHHNKTGSPGRAVPLHRFTIAELAGHQRAREKWAERKKDDD